jgi:hypothetical protein
MRKKVEKQQKSSGQFSVKRNSGHHCFLFYLSHLFISSATLETQKRDRCVHVPLNFFCFEDAACL